MVTHVHSWFIVCVSTWVDRISGRTLREALNYFRCHTIVTGTAPISPLKVIVVPLIA